MAYIQVHEEEFFFCPNSGHTGQPMAELFPLDVPFDSMNFDVCIAITGLIWLFWVGSKRINIGTLFHPVVPYHGHVLKY
jgi:hypothetical protein